MSIGDEKGDKPVQISRYSLAGGGFFFFLPGPESGLGGPASVFPCEVNHEMSISKNHGGTEGRFCFDR